jgi:1-deoxy-D-xylulose-5-phosphate synthase
MSILDSIVSPRDLKKVSAERLPEVAAALREVMVVTVADIGGHLGASLGVVELTIALHRVFETPRDKIVWDVGHQCYAHKILTGRKRAFETSLRRIGGLSGFPRREESEHDAFGTGHASTSISAAMGLAAARDLEGESFHVVAVIGDGALTGGEAYEGLNNAGHAKTNLIVVLNDNRMSIGRNVGAISTYLSRMRSHPRYYRAKSGVERAITGVLGRTVTANVRGIKNRLKYLVVPGVLFEELGFTYLGPIDGHNVAGLEGVLARARAMTGPVLVHVITRKGKGYAPAERDPGTYHNPGCFDPDTGERHRTNGPPSYTEVFGSTLVALAAEDRRIVGITAAMPDGTGLYHMAKAYPDRFFDVGIAEQHAVTFAAGLAAGGQKPVCAIYSTFLQRAFDQIYHDVCLQNLPVVLALDRAGVVGEDGPTHHGLYDLSWLRPLPNLVIMAPKDENELRHMLKTALSAIPGPAAIRYPRGSGLGVPLDPELASLPIGKAEVLVSGSDAAVLAVGTMVAPAVEAARILADRGVGVTVVNARFVKPLDEALVLELGRRIGRLVCVEENVTQGGFGAAVLETLARGGVSGARVTLLGFGDAIVAHGAPDLLRERYGLDAPGIVRAVLSLVAPGPEAR